jgi:elongation factor Ts
MAITAQDVNKLRTMTGAGMMDCKKALTEADGNFDVAIDILRKKGQKVSASRSDRNTTEGAVFITTNADATKATIVALGCETDFVAKNEEFQALGQKVLRTAVNNQPESAGELLTIHMEDGRAVQDHLTDLMGKIGEKIEVVAYGSVTGDKVATYTHSNGKVGVLVGLKNVSGANVTEVGKDVAMHIAAMRPVAVDKDGVDPSTVQREIEIGKEQARAEGKPEAMLEKIAMGKLNKFYKDSTLLNQEFVKDNSKTVAQVLDSVHKGLTVSDFKRVQIG